MTTSTPTMPPHFVLVHGASHGAWCWYKVRLRLEKEAYRVSCLDMAGAGIHPSDPNTVLTFDHYNKPLTDFMAALPEDEKVILVGHSLGGLNVTDAMNRFTNKVEMAVYVNAAMFTIKDDNDGGDYRKAFEMWHGLGPDKLPTSALMRKEYHRKLLYNTSPEEDLMLAAMLLRPCPIMAAASASIEVGDGLEKVKRVCIRGTSDTFFKLEKFEKMIKKWPPSLVLSIESDHCPFFSAPDQLFNSFNSLLPHHNS